MGINTIYKTHTKEYWIYHSMLQRCYNKKDKAYKNYGGRGIEVSARWRKSFDNFIEDMGKRPSNNHSLDRKDNKIGYFGLNCRWVTRDIQNRNHRRNNYITFGDENITITDWINKLCVPRTSVYRWIRRGMSKEDALLKRYGIKYIELINE